MLAAALLLLLLPVAPPFERHLREGVSALSANNLAVAREHLEAAVKLDSRSAQAWFLLAQIAARQGDLKQALHAASQASNLAGAEPSLLYNLALFYREAARPAEFLALAKRASLSEDSEEVHSLLGQAYAVNKELPQAIAQFAEVRRRSPYSEQAIFQLAQAHMQAQDFPSAVTVIEEGRKTFDKSPQLELALGVAYYGQRRFAEAVDRFLRVTALAPDVPQAYYFMGRILEHATNRIAEVTERAAAFEKSHPQSPLGYVLHARAVMLDLPPGGFPEQAAEAQALLDKALALKEDQADAHYLLGTLLERKRDYAAARRHLERAVALNPADAPPHFRLARVYERLGLKEEAAAQRALHEKLSAEEGTPPVPPAR